MKLVMQVRATIVSDETISLLKMILMVSKTKLEVETNVYFVGRGFFYLKKDCNYVGWKC